MPKPNIAPLLILTGIALLILLLAWFLHRPSDPIKPSPAAELQTPNNQQYHKPTQSSVEHPIAQTTHSLNHSKHTAEEDLILLKALIDSYRSVFGENPVGFNDEITAALIGNNPKKIVLIPPNHPAISAKGELLDRWGTPLRFHALSGKHLEIRSAGPDTTHFTQDDITSKDL